MSHSASGTARRSTCTRERSAQAPSKDPAANGSARRSPSTFDDPGTRPTACSSIDALASIATVFGPSESRCQPGPQPRSTSLGSASPVNSDTQPTNSRAAPRSGSLRPTQESADESYAATVASWGSLIPDRVATGVVASTRATVPGPRRALVRRSQPPRGEGSGSCHGRFRRRSHVRPRPVRGSAGS